MEPLSVTIEQASRLSGLSRSEIYRKLADGQLKAKKNGKRVLISYGSLTELLNRLPDAEFTPPPKPEPFMLSNLGEPRRPCSTNSELYPLIPDKPGVGYTPHTDASHLCGLGATNMQICILSVSAMRKPFNPCGDHRPLTGVKMSSLDVQANHMRKWIVACVLLKHRINASLATRLSTDSGHRGFFPRTIRSYISGRSRECRQPNPETHRP
jgi:excisionase family DNA binding protein